MAAMNITGEQIKEARERRQMTQQELADELGVSMRTVGSWERGESVPRSRMGAIREALELEGPDDNRHELGRLIREDLESLGRGPTDVVKLLPTGLARSFYFWLSGTNVPRNKSRVLLEDALGWRRGSVTRILEAPITEHLTLSEVRDWGLLEEPVLAKASELSTDELLIELTRRVGALQSENERLKSREDAPTRDMYDQAANSTAPGRNVEHLEDGED